MPATGSRRTLAPKRVSRRRQGGFGEQHADLVWSQLLCFTEEVSAQMMRIYYSGGSLLTGDALAASVLAYAEALAKSPRADIVQIPVLVPDSDDLALASLLIGPASQLMSVPELSHGRVEPFDALLVDDLERRSLLLGSPRPIAQTATIDAHDDYD
jgi:hypothetical protein